jgi:F0F1-type ATP synthase alpha subunit
MHQSLGQTRSLSESVALLFAASKGMLDKIGADSATDMQMSSSVIEGVLEHVRRRCAREMETIDETLEFSFETKRALEKELSAYFETAKV